MIQELVPGVFWVGVVDWGLKQFHGHELSTHRGSSYNAYLIVDQQVALVDTVWGSFAEQMMANIREIIDPARIDWVVANHAESDHSGGLPALLREAPQAKLVVSRRGAESIEGHYHAGWPMRQVKTGESIDLGGCQMVFVEAPMLHWPDSMFTYLAGKEVLLPNDAFGQHYATAFRFNDQVDQQELFEEARKYYANILTPFSELVLRKIDEVLALKLPVQMIAPSHGVIWRDNPLQIVTQYQTWAKQVPERRAVILYDTMWEGTRHLAEALGAGLVAEGVPYKLFHMATSDRNDVITEVFSAGAVLVGSPTFNRGVLATISPILEDLRGLGFKNKIGAAFGTYGWSGESPKLITKHLQDCGIRVVGEPLAAKWQPNAEDLERGRALGRQVAQALGK
jgi:flavorubredoxin